MQLTIDEIKQLAGCAPAENESHPYEIGQAYLIRTVTHIQTGRLMAVHRQELVIEDAAWIADTGRFMQALKDGALGEVEPFPDGPVIIGRAAIIDVAKFQHALPRSQK